MWTADHRRAAHRRGLHHPSDLTDAERALIAPMISPAKHCGRNRRLAGNFERHVQTVVAFNRLAMIRITLRRPATTHSR